MEMYRLWMSDSSSCPLAAARKGTSIDALEIALYYEIAMCVAGGKQSACFFIQTLDKHMCVSTNLYTPIMILRAHTHLYTDLLASCEEYLHPSTLHKKPISKT